MSKSILIILCSFMVGLTACQHKLPKAKGKWVDVNGQEFIPPNTTKYRDDVSTLPLDKPIEIVEKTKEKSKAKRTKKGAKK